MDLRRLPPAMLIALGLGACGSDDEGETAASTTGTTSSTGEPSTGPRLDVSACLKFDVPPPTTQTDTGGSTGGSTGDDTDGTGTDGTDTAPEPTTTVCLSGVVEDAADPDERPLAPRAATSSREATIDRLADAGVLPDDVIAKLRTRRP